MKHFNISRVYFLPPVPEYFLTSLSFLRGLHGYFITQPLTSKSEAREMIPPETIKTHLKAERISYRPRPLKSVSGLAAILLVEDKILGNI